MKTDMMIKNLTQDLKPWSQLESLGFFTLKKFLLTLALSIFCLWLLPWRLDIATEIQSPFFLIENIIWVVVIIIGAMGLHESSIPGTRTKIYTVITAVSIFLLFLLAMAATNESLASQFVPEMDLWRGRCGFLICAFAILEAPFLVSWAKRGAPSKPEISGAYAALTSGASGCLLMQVICGHHNSLHLIIWHFIPLTLLSFLGIALAKKILRW